MTTLLHNARAGKSLSDVEIIDMHGHIGPFNFAIPDQSIKGLVQMMDRVGVRQVAVSHMLCMTDDMVGANDGVHQAMVQFPDRILGYIAVFPLDVASVRREVALRIQQGFAGIKLHNCNGFAYDDSVYMPAFELAQEHALPVLLHVWGEASVMDQVRRLSARFPDISFLLAHTGAAGQEEAYIKTARECPNVYCELAISVSFRGLVERLVNALGADKVVWGSDVYFFSQTQQIGKVIGARISEEEQRKILGGNARRILKRRR